MFSARPIGSRCNLEPLRINRRNGTGTNRRRIADSCRFRVCSRLYVDFSCAISPYAESLGLPCFAQSASGVNLCRQRGEGGQIRPDKTLKSFIFLTNLEDADLPKMPFPLTFRSKPERIGDESGIRVVSRFVHPNILYYAQLVHRRSTVAQAHPGNAESAALTFPCRIGTATIKQAMQGPPFRKWRQIRRSAGRHWR